MLSKRETKIKKDPATNTIHATIVVNIRFPLQFILNLIYTQNAKLYALYVITLCEVALLAVTRKAIRMHLYLASAKFPDIPDELVSIRID